MISIVIGVYNEERVLPRLVDALLKDINLKEGFEIIFVNDGSKDNTKRMIEDYRRKYPWIKLVSYERNTGLGNALKLGFRKARGRVIVTMDADLAHPPSMVKEMVDGLEGSDMVIGSRYVGGGVTENLPKDRDFLSRWINLLARLITRSGVRDMTSGFRAYRADIIKNMPIRETGFEVQLEILVKLMRSGAIIKEIPLNSVDPRIRGSKFSLARDGPKYFYRMLKMMAYRWA